MTLRLGGDGAITGCTSLENPDLTVSGLTISGSFDAEKVLVASGTDAAPSYTFSGDTDTGIYSPGANQFGITIGGSQGIYINADRDVGISVNNPSARLDVVDTAAGKIANFSNGNDADIEINCNTGGVSEIGPATAGVLALQTSNTERLRIDSSGNVGIGTTSPQLKFVVSNSGANGFEVDPTQDSGATTGINSYNRSGSAFTKLRLNASIHQFDTSSTERMRIDSSGNVGIGTTSPSANLHVVDSSSENNIRFAGTASTVGTYLLLQNTNTTNGNSSILEGNDAQGQGVAQIQFINVNHTNNEGALAFNTRPSGGTSTERMRIDSSGKVGIGVTSPTNTFHVVDGNGTDGSIDFGPTANRGRLYA